MIVLSTSKKFVFFHIPKNGGTSISASLARLRDPDMTTKYPACKKHHITFRSLLRYHDIALNEFFLFCFIRNPWDRLVSWFRWSLYKKGLPMTQISGFTFFIKLILHRKSIWDATEAWIPQSEWIFDDSGKNIMNFVGKYENLQEDFDIACRMIGISRRKLPHRNHTNHTKLHYSRYYTDELVTIVGDHFREDVKFGKYKFETE